MDTREQPGRSGAGFHAGLVLDGRYRLERPLGEGGMGAVWVGHQIALDRAVAIKVLHVTDVQRGTSNARLRREALALAAVHHPAVVEVYDYGETTDGVPYVVMELVRGEGLAERMARRGALPAEEAVALVLPLLDGLAAAHRAGIIHRDIKPENVILAAGRDGRGGEVAKLLDFGIASVTVAGDEARLTSDGGIIGTPAYMAPEQMRGEATDERTDVWGVGALVYELIAGEPPFGEGNLFAVLGRVVSQPPPYPRRAQGLDGRLWALLMDALRKDPAERTPSATALRDALAGWLAPRPARVASPAGATPPPALSPEAAAARLAPTLLASSPAAPIAPSVPSPSASLPLPADDVPPSFDGLIRAKLDR